MNTLFIENQMDLLVDALINEVNSDNENKDNLISPPLIVVPNNAVRNWLSLSIAGRKGVCLNFDFLYVDKYIQSLFSKSDFVPISSEMLQRVLLEILSKDNSDFPEISAYLANSDSLECSKKLFQLTGQLVDYYVNYYKFRQDFIQTWTHNRNHDTDFFSKMKLEMIDDKKFDLFKKIFLWQGKLLNLAETRIKKEDSAINKKRLFIPQLMNEYLDEKLFINKNSNRKAYFFGTSFLSELHINFFTKIDNISMFLFYPSSVADSKMDNEIISTWNKPASELFHCIQNNFPDKWAIRLPKENEIPLNNSLRIIKDAVFHGHKKISLLDKKSFEELPQNFSVILSKTMKREIEAVADEICSIIIENKDNEAFYLNDVAIISNNIDSYYAVIEDVLSEYNIPFQTIEGKIRNKTRLVEGLEALLHLSTSDYTRSDVLKIINHPNFIKRFGEDVNTVEWERWIEALGIFIGINYQFNREDAGLLYIDKDVFNWEQGFKRLLLGAFIDNPSEITGENRDFIYQQDASSADRYIPLDEYQLNYTEITGFLRIIQSMINDTKELAKLETDAHTWSKIITDLFTTYFSPEEKEDSIYNRIISHISDIASYRLPENDDNLSFILVREIILNIINGIKLGAGMFPAGGVVITDYENIRPIPFSYTFLIGLEQDNFPSQKNESNLNLAHYTKRTLQNSKREQDCFLFLERILLTKQSLFFSYTHHDIQKDRIVYPSTCISEIIKLLPDNTDNLDQTKIAYSLFKEIPLKSYSEKYLSAEKNSLHAFNQYSIYNAIFNEINSKSGMHNHYEMEDGENTILNTLADDSTGSFLVNQLNLDNKKRLKSYLKSDNSKKIKQQLSLSLINNFIEDPLQASVKSDMGIYEDEDDDTEIIFEPLGTNSLSTSVILKNVFIKTFTQNDKGCNAEELKQEAARILDIEYELSVLQGNLPAGYLKKPVYQHYKNILYKWIDDALNIRNENNVDFSTITQGWIFGSKKENENQSRRFPALEIKKDKTDMIVTGNTEILMENAVVYLSSGKNIALKHYFKTFITLTFLAAYYECRRDELSDDEKSCFERLLYKDNQLNCLLIILGKEENIVIPIKGDDVVYKELIEYFYLLLSEINSKELHDYLFALDFFEKQTLPENVRNLSFNDLRNFLNHQESFRINIINAALSGADKLADEDSWSSSKKYKSFKDISRYSPPNENDTVTYFINRLALLFKYMNCFSTEGKTNE